MNELVLELLLVQLMEFLMDNKRLLTLTGITLELVLELLLELQLVQLMELLMD